MRYEGKKALAADNAHWSQVSLHNGHKKRRF